MLAFAESFKTEKKYSNSTIVPARGSMGVNIHTQSNHVVALTSKKLNCNYRLLNIPDELGEDAMKSLTQEPEIKTTLDSIEKTDILVFGVGRADEMATRRNLTKEKVDDILSKGAIGEAFGYYFNREGKIVYKLYTVGIDLETFKRTKATIAV